MTNIIKRGRILGADDDVFSQNAWDDTDWTAEMQQEAEQRIEEQKEEAKELLQTPDRIVAVEEGVTNNWNGFYGMHEDKFFKDRRWIFSEFPEILSYLEEDSGPCNILEVGCGVGNAVAHIVKTNKNPKLHIYCCDLAHNAIKTLMSRDIYLENAERLTPFQANICESDDGIPIEPASLDFIMLIFTLSAMKPELMQDTISKLTKLLRPNGMFLVRDYARFDMTQLRFKGRSYLRENYYVRSDGTTSYFFTRDMLDSLFMSNGHLEQIELKNDNRLLVNRLKSLKMCRCWIQAKYKRTNVGT